MVWGQACGALPRSGKAAGICSWGLGGLQLWVRVLAAQCLGAALELGTESPLRPSGDSVFNLFLLKTVTVI